MTALLFFDIESFTAAPIVDICLRKGGEGYLEAKQDVQTLKAAGWLFLREVQVGPGIQMIQLKNPNYEQLMKERFLQ